MKNAKGKAGEVNYFAQRLMRSYCSLSWPVAWNGASEETKRGWRRTAKSLIRDLDKYRATPPRQGAA